MLVNEDVAIIVDKPQGISSRDASNVIRKHLGLKKVGHLGTLDVEASGLLIVLSGAATKLERFLHSLQKTYEGEIVLGSGFSTDDIFGEITAEKAVGKITEEDLLKAKEHFSGSFLQTPPQVSAKKINGKVAYKEVREGRSVSLSSKAVECEILELSLLSHNTIRYVLSCSSGFYVRAFARDLGFFLDTYGAASIIRRTQVGVFGLNSSAKVSSDKRVLDVPKGSILKIGELGRALPLIHRIIADCEVAKKIRMGNKAELDRLLAELSLGIYVLWYSDELCSVALKEESGVSFLCNFL